MGQPLFTPEETGLPAIRRYLKTVNINQNLNLLRRHIEENIAPILSQLQRICRPVSGIGETAPIETVVIIKLYKPRLEAITTLLIQSLEYSFNYRKIVEEGALCVQMKISKEAMGKWFPESLQPDTLRAILKNGGTYREMQTRDQLLADEPATYNWNLDVAQIL
jgi:hypothetical protein